MSGSWRKAASVAGALCLLGLPGCGVGGGGGDGGEQPVQGYTFTAENTEEAASVAAGTLGLFPPVGAVIVEVVGLLEDAGTPAGRAGARVEVDTGGLCAAGSAGLVWDDNDGSGDLSSGDAATLTFEACVLGDEGGDGARVDGTLSLAFAGVTVGGPVETAQADVVMDVTVEEEADGGTQTTTLTGSFRVGISADNGAGTLSVTYGGVDRSDVLTWTPPAAPEIRFGCFDVAITSPVDGDDEFTLAARGVASVDGGIMQLGRYGEPPDTPLEFQTLPPSDDPVPVSGTLTLLSFDGRPDAGLEPCTVVGSSGEVSTDGSWLRLVATGEGNVRIERYAGPDAQEPEETLELPWGELDL